MLNSEGERKIQSNHKIRNKALVGLSLVAAGLGGYVYQDHEKAVRESGITQELVVKGYSQHSSEDIFKAKHNIDLSKECRALNPQVISNAEIVLKESQEFEIEKNKRNKGNPLSEEVLIFFSSLSLVVGLGKVYRTTPKLINGWLRKRD